MPSTINMLLDKVDWKCTRCGKKLGMCGCLAKNIELRCPECKRKKMVRREEIDPKGTAVIECQCDKCDDGSKVETRYFDANGKQLRFGF